MIIGGKGGTGKTAFLRLLLDRLVSQNITYIAYDADTENPELYEQMKDYGNGVRLLNFLEVAEAKRLFSEVKTENPDVVVLDMPGASGNKTREIFRKFGMFQIAQDLGYRLTLVTVLNLGFSVINSLKVMAEFCKDSVDYVVVKNMCWDKGMGFQRWENSKTKAAIAELKGIEIEMPELEYSTFDVVLEKGLSFSAAREENGFPYGDYLLVSGFLIQATAEVDKAAGYLGLSAPAAAAKSRKTKATTVETEKPPEKS